MNKDIIRQEYMDVDIVLGNPKIKCDGYGICKFVTKSNSLKRTCMNFNQFAKAQIRFVTNGLDVHFDKNSLSPAAYEKYFADGVFRIDSDAEIPEDITLHFNLPPSVLEKGFYPIRKTKYGYNISISIKERQKYGVQIVRRAA
jgi:hypothetical protein